MKTGNSDQIRQVAKEKYVDPALRTGQREFSIPVRGILESLPPGFPRNHTPQICSSIQTAKFLNQNGLRIVRIEGPPSGQSTSVVVHYRVAEGATSTSKPELLSTANAAERAHRLTNGLKGLLSKELAEHGGAEAFVRWIRSDDKEAA
jgi:hypothetical protein